VKIDIGGGNRLTACITVEDPVMVHPAFNPQA
jgi:hypothetical protein